MVDCHHAMVRRRSDRHGVGLTQVINGGTLKRLQQFKTTLEGLETTLICTSKSMSTKVCEILALNPVRSNLYSWDNLVPKNHEGTDCPGTLQMRHIKCVMPS
jgi:hypothetical protein